VAGDTEDARPPIRLRFDLRVPPFAATTFAAQYAACLEMCEWAERIGADSVTLSEHHGDPAGFTPAPITLAAAVLGRTRRIPVSIAAALAPLHDPVRLAEQLATVDCLAPGRLSVVLGAGYRVAEFEMAGVDRRRRGPLLEECVEVLRAAWRDGQAFDWRGRRVVVTPPPATPGGPPVLIGGKTEAAARRAARLRCAFAPAVGDTAVAKAYRDECAAVGFADGVVVGLGDPTKPPGPGFLMVSREPEATWELVAPHAMYDAETYASWQDDEARSDWVVPDIASADDLRASGRYAVVSPDECAALAERHGGVTLHPLMGGIAPDLAWESLRLFEEQVLPRL
jgi:alkanesulfonate monooxygenase SsuD/methylene tetrahydromethanopterin reductase-like flavin-dependent oxidoreductase (luciferase family)